MNEFNAPQKLANRPGLLALNYRLGDYYAFRHYLLERLSVHLPSLAARDLDDAGIALLDAWAVVGDVLTFYQERIANEGYLRTATELRSVLELARSIGYELKPGTSASTYLAFTTEERPETAAGVQIPLGTQVMSIPSEGESPQTFETSETILARPDWNALKPRTSKPPEVTASTQQLYLQGLSTQLAPGDPILLVGEVEQEARSYLRFLTTVEPLAAVGQTRIAWEQLLPLPPQTFLRHLKVFAFRLQASLFGHNAPRWQEMPTEIKRQAGGTLIGGVFGTPLLLDEDEDLIAWEAASEGLPNQDILCLAAKDDAGYLFAGTAGSGIFRCQVSDGKWKAVNTGLTNLTVQALFVDERGHIFAGTPNGGAFRSKDGGNTWVPIGTGTVRVEFEGNPPTKGEAVNTGLPNTVIRSLLAYESAGKYYIFAGTDDSIYRTTNGGQDWYSEKTPSVVQENPDLKGLPDTVVHCLQLVETDSISPVISGNIQSISFDNEGDQIIEVNYNTSSEELTDNSTIFVAAIGQSRQISKSASGSNEFKVDKPFKSSILPGTSLIAFISKAKTTIAQIYRGRKRVKVRINFAIIQKDDILAIAGQTVRITKIESLSDPLLNKLTLEQPLHDDVNIGGELIVLDTKATATIKDIEDLKIKLTDINNIQENDILIIHGNVRRVVRVLDSNDNEIILDREIDVDLKGKKVSAIKTKGSAIIQEIDGDNQKKIKIKDVEENLEAEDIIAVSNQTRKVIEVIDQGQDLLTVELELPFESSLQVGHKFVSPPPPAIFAGTDNGVYRSTNNGIDWEEIGLQKDSDNPAIVYALAVTYSNSNPAYIFAGTNKGIYRAEYTSDGWEEGWNRVGLAEETIHSLTVFNNNNTTIFAGTKDGVYSATSPEFDTWSPFNKSKINKKNIRDLSGVEVLSVQIVANETNGDSSDYLFAGTRFVGFVEDKPGDTDENGEVTKKAEWPDFQIKANEIDLDTLYPKIIADSWMVLLDKHEADDNDSGNLELDVAAFQVEEVLKVPHKAFTIDAKISRIIPAKLIEQPENFGLRTTTVFGQSEKLELVPDPITVTAKQQQIFLDPIWDNKVFLHQFVQGLAAKKPLLVSGRRIRAKINAGGLFLSRNWQKTLDSEIADTEIQAMTINGDGEIFIATKEGVFRSSDRGVSWQSINQGLEERTVCCLLAYSPTKLNMGKVSKRSGSLELINHLEDLSIQDLELQSGDTITVEHQTRIITDIKKQENPVDDYKFIFTINTEFSRSIATYSDFTINRLLAGTNEGIFRFDTNTQKWEKISQQEVKNIQVLVFNQSSGYIFAGTKNGLFRSVDNGQNWQTLENDDCQFKDDCLKEQDIRCLAVSGNSGEYVFAGTANGKIFWSSNADIIDDSLDWEFLDINVDVTEKVVQSLAFELDTDTDTKGKLYVGMKEGILCYQYDADAELKLKLDEDGDTCPRLGEDIRCLTINGNYVFAGTETGGIFRLMSLNNYNFWRPINAGLKEGVINVFARNPQSSEEELWVGTKEGIFYTQENGKNWTNLAWEQSNQNLIYTSVQSLAQYQQAGKSYLFVGTREGVFRSRNYGQNWEPINEGLTDLNIQALAVVDISDTIYLLAGTANGIFRTRDGGRSWQPSMGGLSSPNVQVMAVKKVETAENSVNQLVFAGTLEGGVFISKDGGQNWKPTALTQQKIQALAVVPNDIPETDHLQPGSILAGTPEGIFYSPDDGSSWESWVDYRAGIGTICSDELTVRGQGTDFSPLRDSAGKVKITGNSQTRTVIAIDSQNPKAILTVDRPFRPELLPGTPFTLSTGLQNLNVTALAIDSQGHVFAGTGGSGIFYTKDGGQWWDQINEGLTNLEIRCLFADTKPNGTGKVFAGTFSQKILENGDILPLGGVFSLKEGGESWEAIEVGMTNIEVRAITNDGVNILVGGTGILLATGGFNHVPLEPADWLEVIAAPTAVAGEAAGVQKWQVRNWDGFAGTAGTAGKEEISLYPASEEGEIVSEFCRLQTALEDQQQPILSLEQPLKYSYDPETVKIYANLVTATHGETVSEILGSGGGRATNQKFAIQKLPLTYTLDPTVGEARSTLKVYVNDVQWSEVPSLYSEGLDSRKQCYMIRTQVDGTTEIVFGDGEAGARPPSGLENITATYRSGSGSEGNVGHGSLSLLKTRPLGVAEVTNPLAATGGAAREELAAARSHAPASVRTLGRIVSLQDFADFALTFPSIGKAQAVPLWDGSSQFLHLTVAGVGGAPVPPESLLYKNLVEAIAAVGNPAQKARVDSYEPLYFQLEAKVALDAKYKADKVLSEIESALQQVFSFAVREFGQPVTKAEAIATIANVPGVVAVNLEALYRRGGSKAANSSLEAATAIWDREKQQVRPAQLLLLAAGGITLSQVTTL